MITYDICIIRNTLGSSIDKLFIITNKKIENKKQQQMREGKKKNKKRKILHLFDFFLLSLFFPPYFTSFYYLQLPITSEKKTKHGYGTNTRYIKYSTNCM